MNLDNTSNLRMIRSINRFSTALQRGEKVVGELLLNRLNGLVSEALKR
jgi:hypothetical protein